MSANSNDNGRAFEFRCLLTLQERISEKRNAVIEKNSSYFAAQRAWESVTLAIQEALSKSAYAAVEKIFELEPMILDENDTLTLLIQPDTRGEEGDVRDILIIRRTAHWEIGLSLKHNHFAVKHSRLAHSLDFGKSWFDVPCSEEYWQDVKPVFAMLAEAKEKKLKWSQLSNKAGDVYIPLLQAFIDEVKRSSEKDKNVPKKMVEYLLGKFDFYKVISLDKEEATEIHAFNLRGTLNRASTTQKARYILPRSTLPTRIATLEFKPKSKTTVELYMDGGWQFSFRIHNASEFVEPSLKFDIKFVGTPAAIKIFKCVWD